MRQRFPAEIKSRVTAEMKARLEQIAAQRYLDLSDIVREAFREYLAKRSKPSVPQAGGGR